MSYSIEDPAPSRHGTRKYDWASFASFARENSGKWVKFDTPVQANYAQTIKKGLVGAFKPAGSSGFDYANVELRIVAGLAQERAMIEAFANGVDIHKATASTMLKVPLDEVTDKQRSVGKTLNFAIVYGSGADNIATLITFETTNRVSSENPGKYDLYVRHIDKEQ